MKGRAFHPVVIKCSHFIVIKEINERFLHIDCTYTKEAPCFEMDEGRDYICETEGGAHASKMKLGEEGVKV